MMIFWKVFNNFQDLEVIMEAIHNIFNENKYLKSLIFINNIYRKYHIKLLNIQIEAKLGFFNQSNVKLNGPLLLCHMKLYEIFQQLELTLNTKK